MGRPLRAFLSYRRLDASEAAELERQLALRGLSLWRDVNDLPLGGLTEAEIRRGIAQSDAFILYVTPRVFSSDVIWRVEVPAAIARARREARQGRTYPIVPLLRGVTTRELRRGSTTRGVTDLPKRNGAFVALRRGNRATKRARREAYADVAKRLLRSLLPGQPPGPLLVTLRSFAAPEAIRPTLDVDWSDALDGANARVWNEELVPALRDLKAELARAHRRQISLFVKTRLCAALLVGMVLPLASGFELAIRDRQGRWPTRAGRGRLRREDRRHERSGSAVLEVSLAQDARSGARSLSQRLHARHVRLTPPAGPSRTYDPRPNAGGIARQVGDVARELRAAGAGDVHIVFSGPAALTALVGQHLHAIGTVHCYYRGAHGRLVRSNRFRT